MPFKEILGFLTWWGKEVPRQIMQFTKDLLLSCDNSLQFTANLRLWLALEPLFGDYTWSGRAVGVLMRGLRVVATVAVYLVVLVLGLTAVVFWYVLPFVILLNINLN
ncbi:MAG: hypothetical protein V1807_02215 [Patescibacteria group bacterium]